MAKSQMTPKPELYAALDGWLNNPYVRIHV